MYFIKTRFAIASFIGFLLALHPHLTTNEIMAKESNAWNKVMAAALKLPGVAVDRDKFLNKELSKYFSQQQVHDAIVKGTPGIIPDKILDRIATTCIRDHTRKVTIFSTAMGIPGGWAALGTVPTDIAQFYFHVLVLSQKLAYVYGYPTLLDEDGKMTKSSVNVLTIFVGVMTGVGVAIKALQELGEILQKQLIKKLPEMALTNGVLYPAVRQVAKLIGSTLTKEQMTKGITKALPLISGMISGALTYKTFKPQAKRLGASLHCTMLLPQHSSAHSTTLDVVYEELPPELPPQP